ncbi:MAG: transglycosylase family protein [Candidatus Dormibacteria bacterium]
MTILAVSPVVAASLSSTSEHPTLARAASPQTPAAVSAANASVNHQLPVAVAFAKPVPVPPPKPVPVPPPLAPAKPSPDATPKPTADVMPKPAPDASPSPAPPARTYPPGSVEAIIMAAATAHGVDGSWMIRIASCESGLRPSALNPAGPYIGLFQFVPSTFRAHGGTDIYDPVQQSNIAADMLAHGGSQSWPVCSHR